MIEAMIPAFALLVLEFMNSTDTYLMIHWIALMQFLKVYSFGTHMRNAFMDSVNFLVLITNDHEEKNSKGHVYILFI